MPSNNYISFLDLLGIKEMAKYNPSEYFQAMVKFRNRIIKCAKYFQSEDPNSKSKVHFFSDCCFIESNDIILLFEFLRHLRKELLQDDDSLFFSASVTYGKLGAAVVNSIDNKDLDENIKNMIIENDVSNYLSGTIFQSEDISRVYVLQNEFKGTGIFIDEGCIEVWKNTFETKELFIQEFNKYITKSFYFPSINTNTVKSYYDLKILDTENRKLYFHKLIERYYSSNAKNKKYGRFYLAYLANWVSSSDYNTIEYDNENETLVKESLPVALDNLINKNFVINEIKRNAHFFEYIFFFVLYNLYEDRKAPDSVTNFYIKNVLCKNPKNKKLLSNLDSIPNAILPPKYKDILLREYHKLLVT